MTTTARLSSALTGSVLVAFGLLGWCLLAETALRPEVSAVEWVLRAALWIAPTAGGAALLRRRHVAMPEADDRRRRRLRWSLVAFGGSIVTAVGHVLVARWVQEHHATNGPYGFLQLPFAALVGLSGIAFYSVAWSAFVASRRFEAPLALMPPVGVVLLTGLVFVLQG
ncbi:MAG: hypothetical protein AAF726_06160 [Planctomycetota bacterium]